MKIIINVQFSDGKLKNGKGSFWHDSIKGDIIEVDDTKTIHKTIADHLQEKHYLDMCYGGKPINKIFRGEGEQVGWVYRIKTYLSDRSTGFSGYVYFDAWVEIQYINPFKFD